MSWSNKVSNLKIHGQFEFYSHCLISFQPIKAEETWRINSSLINIRFVAKTSEVATLTACHDSETDPLDQWFSNCGTRTISGT